MFPGFCVVGRSALLGRRDNGLSQLADAPPAIAAGPLRNQFQDAVNGSVFLGGAEFNPSSE